MSGLVVDIALGPGIIVDDPTLLVLKTLWFTTAAIRQGSGQIKTMIAIPMNTVYKTKKP